MPKTRQALKWYRVVLKETFLEAIKKWHFPTNIFPWNCDRFLKGALLRKCPPITYLLNELVDYVWVSLVSLGLWKSLSINILKFWEEETNGINKSVSCEITSLRVHQTLTNQTYYVLRSFPISTIMCSTTNSNERGIYLAKENKLG